MADIRFCETCGVAIKDPKVVVGYDTLTGDPKFLYRRECRSCADESFPMGTLITALVLIGIAMLLVFVFR